MIDNVRRSFVESMRRRRAYLAEAREAIRRDNLDMVCTASSIALCLLVLFLVITPGIVHGWTPSPYHLAFLPVQAAFTACALLYRHVSTTRRLGTVFSAAFVCILCLFIVLIDAMSDPNAPSSFAPALFVALPSLFVMSVACMYSIVLFFAVGYCLLVVTVKNPAIAQYDVFQMVVAFLFSLCVAYLVMGYRVQAHEISMRFRSLSMHDALSGIYNKRTLLDIAERLLAAKDPGTPCAVLIIDLDDFKSVNDEHGHMVGDAVLGCMGRLLRERFHRADAIGRFGGDEFVVLLVGQVERGGLEEDVASLQRQFAEAGAAEAGLQTTCSVGGAVSLEGTVDFAHLLRWADEALYQAKSAGKNRFFVRELSPASGSALDPCADSAE